MEINNSRVLITGGSSESEKTAKQFIAKGAKVVITGDEKTKKSS
jgi:3-oxoacyl-[acyl-carrier protein] reductase